MRVVVATDAVAGLSPVAASECVARAFAEAGAQVAVIPLGVGGASLAEALAAAAPEAVLVRPATPQDVAAALDSPGDEVVLDLTEVDADGWGEATLGLLGDSAAEALAATARRWDGRRLVALVPDEHARLPLAGLSGWAATRGREVGADLSSVLTADARAEAWAASLGVAPAPGAGAAGGLGLVIQAMGGSIVSPLDHLAERLGVADTMAVADLVVTGADDLDFHSVGGPIVKAVVAMAGQALRPVIAVASRTFISAREMRLAGLEEAYPILAQGASGPAGEPELAALAARIAATWSW